MDLASEPRRALPFVVHVLLLFASTLVLADLCIELTRANGRIASIWLVNALVVASLVKTPRERWPILIAAAGAGMLTANLAVGDALTRAVALSGCNLVESLLVARLLKDGSLSVRRLDERWQILRFLMACAAGPALSALLAMAVLAPPTFPAALATAVNWYVADLLGLVILCPVLFHLRDVAGERGRRLLPNLGNGACAALIGYALFSQPLPLLFVISPLIMAVAFRARLETMLVSLLCLAGIAQLMTVSGSGPIAAATSDPTLRNYLLQGFIAAMTFFVLPVRALFLERQRMAERVANGERMFARIAEASPTAIVFFDSSGQVGYANQRWRALTGVSPIIGRRQRWLDAFAPEDREAALALVARAIESGRPVDDELQMVSHPTRDPWWAAISVYPEMEDGKVRGVVARLSDVTARRRAEAVLQESEQLYRQAIECSPDVSLRLSREGRVTYASSATRRLLDLAPEALVAHPLVDFVHPEDVDLLDQQLAYVDAGQGEPPSSHFRLRTGFGDWRWVEASSSLVAGSAGAGLHEVLLTLRDVTRRRRNEVAAVEAADRLRDNNRLLSMAGDMAQVTPWRWDLNEGMVMVPGPLTSSLGMAGEPGSTRGPQLGDWLAIVHPEDRRAAMRLLAAARSGRGRPTVTLRIVSGHDGTRTFHLAAQRDLDPAGRVRAIVGVARDVSDEYASRAALVEARDRAEAAAEAKSNFLATMSHEIRTPLTGVLGMIDLIRADPDCPERDQYLATLKQSADLLLAVLDDVLDFSKIESGLLKLEERDFDLESLVQQSLTLFTQAASRKGLVLAFRNDCPSEGTAVRGDPVRLQQILVNLMSNAIKFTERGRIDLMLSSAPGATGSRFRIEVRDSGIGFDPKRLSALFDPFVQAEAETSRRFGGTGLGLAIARGLARAMGGTVGASSQPGRGATFWLDVDLPPASGALQSAVEVAIAQGGGRVLDVLIAEDNAVNQLLIGAYMRRHGHRAICVENGRMAVEATALRRFDVILMDMQMPEMDGLAATRAIRASGGPCAGVPIIALTADASAERRRFYDGAGLSAFLTKPIDEGRLVSTMQALCTPDAEPAQGPSGAGTDAPPGQTLNAARLVEIASALGDARLAQLLSLLADQCSLQPSQLERHFRAGDDHALAAMAHSLKGAASCVGADALAGAAACLETADAAGRRGALDALLACLAATREAIEAVEWRDFRNSA